MSLRKNHHEDDNYTPADFAVDEEDIEVVKHRRKVRKMLEDRLEQKRLHDEIDEFDSDFDWDDVNN